MNTQSVTFKLTAESRCPRHRLICKDTTVGSIYEGTLYPAGFRTHGIAGATIPLDHDMIIFIDDAGDPVTAYWKDLHKLRLQQVLPVDIRGTVVPAKRKYTKVSSGKRQFDIKYKRKVVATVQKLRKTGVRGDIKRFLDLAGLKTDYVFRWEQQIAQGVLKKSNAVAFSSNPDQMVRG